MDRLSALVFLRLRLGVRAFRGARERGIGLLFILPIYTVSSVAGSGLLFVGLRTLEARSPEIVVPLCAAGASLVGLVYSFSPFLAGLAFVETHDIGRLLAFPVPLPILVVSSFLANLAQPMVLFGVPFLIAFAIAIGGGPIGSLGAFLGACLSYALIIATSELVSLLVTRLARDRRLQDLALFVGLGVGFLLSLMPLLLVAGGGSSLRVVLRSLLRSSVLSASPFAFGVRAGIGAGRGDVLGFLLWGILGVASVFVCFGLSWGLVKAIGRGDLDLGSGPKGGRGGARLWFRGALGALLEKDLRLAWREPALRVALLGGLLGPFVFLLFLARSGGQAPSGLFLLALGSITGISTIGQNAFGFERRGVALLFGFPVERLQILLGKNLTAILFRMPGLLSLVLVGWLIAPFAFVPPSLAIAFVTFLLCLGVDNYVSILFPTPTPAPGANPYGGASAGARGLSAALMSTLVLACSLLVSFPFVFLVWLPPLLGSYWLWSVTLPLSVLGAVCVYALLLLGASRLLLRREPETLERILGEV